LAKRYHSFEKPSLVLLKKALDLFQLIEDVLLSHSDRFELDCY
jgi:hypothetical protein